MDQLVAGKLDMAFIAHIISPFSKASNIDAYQLDHYRLYTLVVDNYHAIVSRRHRFAGLDVVTWQDLAEEKLQEINEAYDMLMRGKSGSGSRRRLFRRLRRRYSRLHGCKALHRCRQSGGGRKASSTVHGTGAPNGFSSPVCCPTGRAGTTMQSTN